MSDLRVTDVQAALRHFAGTGHDVLTDDPHNILIHDKKYGMAIGHHLNIKERRGNEQEHSLGSFIHQTESPIVSMVESMRSYSLPPENRYGQGIIRVAPIGPSNGSPFEKEGQTYTTAGVEHNDEPMKGMFSGGHQGANVGAILNRKGPKSRLWVPHEDVHEALAAHHDLQPKLSREELRGFDHPLALQQLLNHSHAYIGNNRESTTLPNTIYKGMVHVSHVGHDFEQTNYVYNPQTEEMHRYE